MGVRMRLGLSVLAIVYILMHRWELTGAWGLNGPVGLLFSVYLVIYAREQQQKGRKQLALFYFFFSIMAFFAAFLAFQ